MIRRARKQKASLAYKQRAPIGRIRETRQQRRTRKDRHEAEVIACVRAYIWQTRPTCQFCGGSRRSYCAGLADQMHEDPSRAQTRGLPPEQRFSLVTCGRVCAACHEDLTHRARTVFADPVLGFMGRVTLKYS